MDRLVVRGTEINVQWDLKRDDFLSLTDIAKIKDSDNPRYIIQNWLRNRNTIEFLGVWETLYNPNFKPTEFEGFRRQAGLNAFTLSPKKWKAATPIENCSNSPAKSIIVILKSGAAGRQATHAVWRYNPDLRHIRAHVASGDSCRLYIYTVLWCNRQ